MRLKVGDAGDGQVDVIAPSGDNRVRFHARMAALLEEVSEGLPHGVLEGLAPHRESLDSRIADEGVRVLCRITASGSAVVPRPEARSGDPTGLADVSRFLPVGYVNLPESHATATCRAPSIERTVLKAMRQIAPVC